MWQQDTPISFEKQLFLFLGRHPSHRWKCVSVSFGLSTNGQTKIELVLVNELSGRIEHLPVTDSAMHASLVQAGQVFTENANAVLAAILDDTAGTISSDTKTQTD